MIIKTDKLELSFIGKPAKRGNTYYFNIPHQYIKDGHIKPNLKYRIHLETIE